jgi:hypothetical protein
MFPPPIKQTCATRTFLQGLLTAPQCRFIADDSSMDNSLLSVANPSKREENLAFSLPNGFAFSYKTLQIPLLCKYQSVFAFSSKSSNFPWMKNRPMAKAT